MLLLLCILLFILLIYLIISDKIGSDDSNGFANPYRWISADMTGQKRIYEFTYELSDINDADIYTKENQLAAIVNSKNDVDYFNCMNMLSRYVSVDDAIELMKLESDSKLLEKIKELHDITNIRGSDYHADFETLEYIMTTELQNCSRVYTTGKTILVLGPHDFVDLVRRKYPGAQIFTETSNIVDIIIVYRREYQHINTNTSVGDIYKIINRSAGPQTIFFSKYDTMIDDYDRILLDLKAAIDGNTEPLMPLPFINAEYIRKQHLQLYYIYSKFLEEGGTIVVPYSIWYCGSFGRRKRSVELLPPNKVSEPIDDYVAQIKKESYFKYCTIMSSVYGRDIESMNSYSGGAAADKSADKFIQKFADTYLELCRKFLITVHKSLAKFLTPEFMRTPQIFKNEDVIICYMMFNEEFIEELKAENKQYVVYVIDYNIFSYNTYLTARLYYDLCGFEYRGGEMATNRLIEIAKEKGMLYSGIYKISSHILKSQMNNTFAVYTFFFSQDPRLIESYKSNRRLYDAYMNDRRVFMDIFIPYIKNTGHLSDEDVNTILDMVTSPYSDDKITNFIVTNIPEITTQSYEKKGKKIANQISGTIAKYGNKKIRLSSYLDIGAIDDSQLQEVSKQLRIPYDKAWGINVDEEEEGHLDYNYKVEKNHIVVYDGMNVPELGGVKKYDLISIFSVLHHIPEEVLSQLAKSIYARCGRYLVIKDNDLETENSITYFMWQHYIFNRKLTLSGYIRTDLTLKKVVEMFEKVGFKYRGASTQNEWVRTYFALFEKI